MDVGKAKLYCRNLGFISYQLLSGSTRVCRLSEDKFVLVDVRNWDHLIYHKTVFSHLI